MKKIVFRDTDGNINEEPDEQFIKKQFFDYDEYFWNAGNGEAAFYYYEGLNRKSTMIVSGIKKYGFMIHHNYLSEERELVANNNENTGIIIEAVIGGEPIECYGEYFLSKEPAWNVVRFFLDTGDRSKDVIWQPHRNPYS